MNSITAVCYNSATIKSTVLHLSAGLHLIMHSTIGLVSPLATNHWLQLCLINSVFSAQMLT